MKVYLPLYPEIHYGDLVTIAGVVKDGKLEEAVLEKKTESRGFFANLREALVSFYQKSFPEPHASLVAGIVLGAKNLPSSFWQALTKTQTAHVVVASGMNVTMVIGFLISLFVLFLARRKAIPFALTAVWGYVSLSGFEAPLVRAAIMGSLVFLAQELGRPVFPWHVLLLTGLIMLIIVPSWISDIGFILSFVATASLLFFTKRVERVFVWIPAIFREGLITSVSAQIGVAPILFLKFGQLNILSPLINALVLWTIPIIMVIGGLAGLIGLLVPAVGKLILYLAYPLTSWFIWIVQIFG